MSNSNRSAERNLLAATLVATALLVAAIAGTGSARAAGVCALVPNDREPSQKMLVCGDTLTVRPAPDTRYQMLYKKGDPLPVGARLDDGALLTEFHPANPREKFQILTPLAVAAVRGTKWAMEVTATQTSTLVLAGAVMVTNRRLNQYVVLTEGKGVDISPTDTVVWPKQWGEERIRALLARFGE
jgi:hypothetical protein